METRLLEVEAGLRWYVIRAKLRKETVVERRIADLELEVFLPWLRLRRRGKVEQLLKREDFSKKVKSLLENETISSSETVERHTPVKESDGNTVA